MDIKEINDSVWDAYRDSLLGRRSFEEVDEETIEFVMRREIKRSDMEEYLKKCTEYCDLKYKVDVERYGERFAKKESVERVAERYLERYNGNIELAREKIEEEIKWIEKSKCPKCGSYDVSRCKPDEGYWKECNNCGHSWKYW